MIRLVVAARVLTGGRLCVWETITLAFGAKALLKSIDALEEGFEYVGLWSSLLGNSV